MKKGLRIRRGTAGLMICILLVSFLFLPPLNATADSSVIRVLLTRVEPGESMTLSLDGSYSIGELTFQRGSQLMLSCAGGKLIVYYEGMAFQAGKEAVFVRHAVPDGQENGIRINGGYPLYCGDMHITMAERQLRAVLHIAVEEYLLGVVPYEMNDAFPPEALKAQAIAARTYALRKAGGSGAYDVVDNTNDQVYRGYLKENSRAAQAVRDTEGVCAFDGKKLANCYYTASNGGQVEIPEHVWGQEGSYITMHTDPYDVENPESVVKSVLLPREPKDKPLGGADFEQALLLLLSEPLSSLGYSGEAEDARILRIVGMEMRDPAWEGSLVMNTLRMTVMAEARRPVSQAMLDDEEISIFQQPATASPVPTALPTPQQAPFAAVEQPLTVDVPVFSCLEPLLGLSINPSKNEIITVEDTEAGYVIASRRYGHGVGMSQRGAQWMAAQYGWDYEQILRFYYPGASLRKIDTQVTPAPAIDSDYLATPGPAATPTPRPTLMPAESALQPGEWRAAVTNIGVNSYLNLRSAPSLEADVVRQLYYGQKLIVTGQPQEGWLQVKTDVIEGYVMEQFTEKTE